MGGKRVISRDELLKYLEKAAGILGAVQKEESSNQSEGCQAAYSLLWYYKECIRDDLSINDQGRYSRLLDAYLGAEDQDVLFPPGLEDSVVSAEDQDLDSRFPQSTYPLNDNQRLAVHKALHFPFSIIKGPPGTGKTETILRIVALALARDEKVAVVSTNSAALETIKQKMVESREKARGKASDEQKELFKVDLASLASCKHVALGNQECRNKACDPLSKDPEDNLGFIAGGHHFPDGEEVSGWEQEKHLEDFLAVYPFVTSTIHSLKKCFCDGDEKKYDLVIMDEASQTDVLVGIVAMSCAKRMVLVGDEEQLPPVISGKHRSALIKVSEDRKLFARTGTAASPYDLGREDLSFLTLCYEVFSNKNSNLCTMLTDHYRCHPAIIGFCNQEIYGGQLHIESTTGETGVPCPIRICWYEGDYRERSWFSSAMTKGMFDKKAPSTCVNRKQLTIMREEEASRLRSFVEQGKSICILSPFRGQIDLLKEFTEHLFEDVAQKEIQLEDEQADGAKDGDFEQVPTLTIRKSQGREFDIVYLLPVEDGNWEWPWSQGRRLVNVAVSRAKEQLHVILSTKMLDREMQERLTLREACANKPADAKDDPDNQEMFVRKLANYARETLDSLSEESGQRLVMGSEFGFHRSAVISIFDEIAYLRNTEERKKDSRPEQCVELALRRMDFEGLLFAKQVTFGHLRFSSGIALSEECGEKRFYSCPERVHFDFVIFVARTRQVVMAIEVDGAFHRFKEEQGGVDCSQMNADDTKNIVARNDCGATLAWLGPDHDGSLYGGNKVECPERQECSAKEAEGVGAKQMPRTQSGVLEFRTGPGDWKRNPNEIQDSSSFVFLRIPSDGSTFCETDALRSKAQKLNADKTNDSGRPTIEDYIHAQLSKFQGHEKDSVVDSADIKCLFVDKCVNAESFDPPKKITACLKEWKEDERLAGLLKGKSPADLNTCLKKAGYQLLEKDDQRHRKPTEKGRKIGMTAFYGTNEEEPFICPEYNRKARKYIVEHMEAVLSICDSGGPLPAQ